MALNPVASTGGYSYAAVTTLDSDASISVQAGDMVIVKISGHNAGAVLPEVSVSLVSGTDAGEAQDWSQYSTNVDILTRFYSIAITESRTALVRTTSDLDLNVFDMEVFHFRADAGEVITVVGSATSKAYGASATIQSGTISVSGDDIIILGGGWNAAGTSLANEQVGGVSADGYVRSGRGGMWYRAFSSGQSDIRATATFGDNDTWLADIIAITAASPAPTGHTLAYDINEGTHGSAPAGGTYEADASVTVAARPVHMVRFGYIFSIWNTAIDGSGTDYAPGTTLTMPDADVTLYAQWIGYHTVTAPLIIRHGSHDPATLSNAEVSEAANVNMFADNASVGEDIWGNSTTNSSTGVDHDGTDPCGLALLYASDSRYLMNRDYNEYGVDASWFSTHSGFQNNFRDNPAFATKISGYLTNMATMASSVMAAFLKFCFIDGPADADAAFDAYMAAIQGEIEDHPGVNQVLWTMPIESAANTDHNPANRQHFNVMTRQIAIDLGLPLYDIADLESDGGTIVSSGRECLSDSYTVDGGHLNGTGKLKAGGAFWRLLDLFAQASSPIPARINHYRQQE